MYYIKYNEIDLTDMVKVREVEIPSLPTIEHSSIDIFERDGGVYNGASYGTREIRLTFIIKPDDKNDYEDYVRDVKRAFYTKEEARLFCGDENLYMWCVPVDEMRIAELGEGCAEAEVNLVSYDPYWYSVDQQGMNNDDKKNFTVDNESDANVYPIIQVGFTKDTTFFQIRNRSTNETILIGGIPEKEKDTIKKNTRVLKDAMETTSGWSNTSAPIDAGRSTGGTLSVTSDGKGLMCGNFGSSSDGAVWHGACYKKSINTPVKDFKVRIRMRHNSTGVNGDPSHPYQNDTETPSSGSKKTYYKVTARSGLILRKSASTSSTKLLTMPYGTKLTGTVSKGWLNTTYNGKTGYCYAQYLKKVTSDDTVTTKQRNYVTMKSTAIRASASKKATNKKTIPAGKCIRCYYDTKYPTTGKDNVKGKFYKLAKPYDGTTGYVWIDNLVQADEYEVDYDPDIETADDKLGVVELYGFSANNVQLFKLSMVDDNEFYEFTYPLIRKNGKDFLKDKTIAPEPKKVTTYNGDTKKVKAILSGKYGSWNEFYGELYIERIKNKWYAYVSKIKEGEVVKTIKSKTVTDKDNQDEELSYIVIYFGTTGNAEKASGMAITDINVYTATKIEDNKEYNFQEFETGDILTIDNNVPAVYLNDEERNDLIDVGSAFFSLEPGENYIKIASDDDVPNVDIMWNDKYL